jgi:peroxiredoxin
MSAISVEKRVADWDVTGVADVLERTSTESGERLVDLVQASPVLLVFLRHAGCTFCREAVADIANLRDEIESNGTRIVLVHMGDRAGIEQLVLRHGFSDVDRICDASQELYRAFGLKKGSWRQLFGPKVWIRGLMAAIGRGHGVGRPSADATQMPGVFFLEQGLVASAYRHRSAADRPCYTSLCTTDNPRNS